MKGTKICTCIQFIVGVKNSFCILFYNLPITLLPPAKIGRRNVPLCASYRNVYFAFSLRQVDSKAVAIVSIATAAVAATATVRMHILSSIQPGTNRDAVAVVGIKDVAYFGSSRVGMVRNRSLNVFVAALIGQ